jgi:hypothetical protein
VVSRSRRLLRISISRMSSQEGMKLSYISNYPSFIYIPLTEYSSPTMARCSAAKETGNPETNFLAPGYSSENPHGRVAYGP